MKFGITVGLVHRGFYEDIAVEAERLNFESLWLPEHLVFPVDMSGSPFPGKDHPPVPAQSETYDPFDTLAYLAAKTSKIRLGTNIYLFGLRHPFVTARAVTTLDNLSKGRLEIGVGAGWLRREWEVAGFDPKTRGPRLNEAIEICRRLWTEKVIEHKGRFYEFEPVMFEPKPIQSPPPIHVGGESSGALKRAAKYGDGWIGLGHTPESVVKPLTELRQYLDEQGRDPKKFTYIINGAVKNRDEIKQFEELGIDRMVSAPWRRSKESLEGMKRYAELVFGS